MNNKKTDQEIADKLIGFLRKRESAKREEEEFVWNRIVAEIEKKEKAGRRIQLYRICSMAATFLLLLGLAGYYVQRETRSSLEQYVGLLQPIATDSIRQIQIHLSDGNQMNVEEQVARIAYSAEGKLSVEGNDRTFSDKKKKVGHENKVAYDQIVVPMGKLSHLVLSDGSTLDINSGTRVVYPRVFESGHREIYVEGEVCLHVAKNEKAPFIVKTESFDIKVLGTTFNVNAYKGASRSEVVLVEGSIHLSDRNERSVVMEPDRLVAVENGEIGKPEVVDASSYITWTEGLMTVSAEPLDEVCRRLERFYGVRINVEPEAGKLEMRGKIDLTFPIEDLIDLIEKTAPVVSKKTPKGEYIISYKDKRE